MYKLVQAGNENVMRHNVINDNATHDLLQSKLYFVFFSHVFITEILDQHQWKNRKNRYDYAYMRYMHGVCQLL